MSKIWGKSSDGSLQYVTLTEGYLKKALNVMQKSFFIDEKISIAVELHKHPAARSELEELCIRAAQDGVSFIAVEVSTDNVVGVAFNKIQVSNSNDDTYFETFAASCKEPSSKALVRFMDEVDVACNLFEVCKVDCILEIMFLAILPEYRQQKIATELCQVSIEAAKLLKSGDNCKTSLKNEVLPLEPIPKAVSAIMTSFITQKLGRNLGFTVAKDITYDHFEFNGKKFSERIGPDTPSTTVEYLLI